MRKLAFLLTALALAAVPAVSLASPPNGKERANAARLCKAQRAQLGSAVFTQKWGGGRNAYGKCVSSVARTLHQNASNAAQQCRAEQNDPNFAAAHGGKTFIQFYGTNANGSDAFLNCVLQKLAQLQKQQQAATVNAAQQCKAEEKQLGVKQFKQKYGSFGNSVSQNSK